MATYQVGILSYDALSFITIEDEENSEVIVNVTEVESNETSNVLSEDEETETEESEYGESESESDEDGDTDHEETEDEYLSIHLYYSSTDVKVSTTSLKIDFNTFVSNVGGGLGLFIGFSFLGGFLYIYDVIASKSSFKVWPEIMN